MIVEQVVGPLDTAPLSRKTPLVVDKTGVGSAVDMFTAAGVKPRAVTITGGNEVNREHPSFNLKVPQRELISTLVALYQGPRLKMAKNLDLAPVLTNELVNFKVKINIATGNDSYEAWRESIHDDLVLAVALACWYAEHGPRAGTWARRRRVSGRCLRTRVCGAGERWSIRAPGPRTPPYRAM